MYYDYFGLKQPPFKITPDTRLFYPGGKRGEILEALIYAILNGEGIIKVVGEVGSGKTMLCRMLEKELPERVEIVYLANPSLSPENTLHAIAFELKLPVQSNTSRLQVMNKLQEYLLQRHAENRQVVVFVEEAQSMPVATLEEIRLLSNLETQQNKLLQIVLFGQPELDELISREEIRQLKERITYSFQLNPFDVDHIKEYLTTRLRACGCRLGELFTNAAIKEIKGYSKGLLRRVNILADKSLLAAYAANTHQISAKHVRQAARDSEFVGLWQRFNRPVYFSLMLVGVCLLGLLIFDLLKTTGPKSAQQQNNPAPASQLLAEEAENEQRQAIGPAALGEQVEEKTISLVSTNKQSSEIAGSIPEISAKKTENIEESITYIEDNSNNSEPDINIEPEILPNPQANKDILARETDAQLAQKSLLITERESVAEAGSLETQLMGLNTVFKLQDFGDSRLSNQESILLHDQLKNLPPEAARLGEMSVFGDTCSLCWSIIYRPLQSSENL